MRIDRIKLPSFRNLVDFEVDFDEDSPRQVIVGRNGVGKSNLLEAITRIFRDLDLEETSTFEYEIDYLCRGHIIRIANEISEDPPVLQAKKYKRIYELCHNVKAKKSERAFIAISEKEFFRRNRRIGQEYSSERLLPNYVFGYYSGTISRFESIFQRHEELYYNAQISGEEAPLRALFLAKPQHSQFAFLSFFAVDDPNARDFLLREMRITGLHSVLFALREPYWGKAIMSKGRPGADPRFWGAAGKVAPFLASLFKNSLFPMAFSERLKVSVGQSSTKERRYCFLPTADALENIAAGLSNKQFFSRLESLVFSNLVSDDGSDVRIWLRLNGVKEPASFQNLAEGERQLLTVLGLLRFTAEDEALFIMDEPDTHLNPAWCLDYLDNLRKYGADLKNSQIIMTTHSPLTFAGLSKNEVVILERDRQGHISSHHPISDPKGMGFQAILTSDFFQLRSTLDKETLQELDRKRELAQKDDRTQQENLELIALDQKLKKLDFTKATRDPLYLEFVRAMSRVQEDVPEMTDPTPNLSDWQLRKKIALDIAERLSKGDIK